MTTTTAPEPVTSTSAESAIWIIKTSRSENEVQKKYDLFVLGEILYIVVDFHRCVLIFLTEDIYVIKTADIQPSAYYAFLE